MRNLKKFTALALAAMMAASSLAGCSGKTNSADNKTSASDGGKVVNIYCWNDEFKSRYDAYAADLAEKHGVTVNFVIVANENNAYQNNLDAALAKQASAAADDKVDVFLIEADYATKYTKSDYSLDVMKDIGLTDADCSQMYQYTKDIVTYNGALKAVSWQATPGLFAYRRSIAKDVLGTDDPTKVQEAISDWDKFDSVAAKMKDKGYFMLSGYDDAYRTFSNNVSAPWVDSNSKIVIDDNIMRWVDQTKEYTEKGYNNKTSLWAPEWSKDQGPDGKVFGFFYSTWGINFTLLGNSLAKPVAEGGKEEVGNGIYGDYAVCYGPESYYWGGTWICAANGTDNVSFIKDMMTRLCCDKETMAQITKDTQDYTNNMAAMEEIANSDFKSDFLGGQNHIALFAEAAKNIDMSNAGDYDQGLNESFQAAFKDYFDGVVTKEKALENFYTSAIEKYPNLKK